MSNQVIGKLLEGARQEFLKDSSREHMVKSASATTVESWLDSHPELLTGIVDKMATQQGLDSPCIKRMVHSSLKFRVLAGTVWQPVEYDDFQGGFCKHQKYDPDTGNFECDPPTNKDAARNWHAAFGHNCACPAWEPPTEHKPKQPTELEKPFQDGDDKYEALQELGIQNRKGDL